MGSRLPRSGINHDGRLLMQLQGRSDVIKSLVLAMLRPDPAERPSADDCLRVYGAPMGIMLPSTGTSFELSFADDPMAMA